VRGGERADGGANTRSEPIASHFLGSCKFSGTSIRGRADFEDVIFSGAADFAEIDFAGPVSFGGARFETGADGHAPSYNAIFSGARFERKAGFERVIFGGNVDFRAVTALRMDFAGAQFYGLADFREASITVIRFAAVEGSQQTDARFKAGVFLRGLTYTRIYGDWRTLLFRYIHDGRPALGAYDRQPFNQFESALRAEGRDQEADELYLERRREENRRDRGSDEPPGGKRRSTTRKHRILPAIDRLFGLIGGYGVDLRRIILSGVILVLVGWVVFGLPGAMSKPWWLFRPREAGLDDALAMSIQQLIPVPASLISGWDLSRAAAVYALFHKLLGGLLLSLAIAAMIGLLHRRSK
jgi:hypothetical protein